MTRRIPRKAATGQTLMRRTARGVEWPVLRARSAKEGLCNSRRERMQSNRLRTGVVLQFAKRREAHGSGLNLGLDQPRKTKSLRGQPLASDGRLNAVSDGGGKRVGPLTDSLRRDADGIGGKLGGAPQEIDSGRLVHEPLKHDFSGASSMIASKESTLLRMDSFGKRLEHALKARRAERKALAAYLCVSPQAVSQIINSPSSAMTAVNTAKAARYLQVSWFWLATGEGDMENVEFPVAKQEAVALANLRAINTLDPSAAERISSELGRIADGLRAQDALVPMARALPQPVSNDRLQGGDLAEDEGAARRSA